MKSVIIIYESKYGNTKQVAGLIAEGIGQVRGTEATLAEAGQVDLKNLAGFNTFLLGSPNHMGGPTAGIKKLIDNLGTLKLENKQFAVFDTYMSNGFEKAVKKMEKQIIEKGPGLRLLVPGLSIRVDGTKGPVTEGELPKCKEFGINFAKKI